MREYGDVAVAAAELSRAGGLPPPEAWHEASRQVFPHSESLQDKGCPRGAYLGLCEDGLVVGIPAGTYSRSRDNKGYAVRAAELLAAEPGLAGVGPKALWDRVMDGQPKAYNSQMDVVLALWQQGLLAVPNERA
jgi:hypothetical protein